ILPFAGAGGCSPCSAIGWRPAGDASVSAVGPAKAIIGTPAPPIAADHSGDADGAASGPATVALSDRLTRSVNARSSDAADVSSPDALPFDVPLATCRATSATSPSATAAPVGAAAGMTCSVWRITANVGAANAAAAGCADPSALA